ncbi:phospholipid hydroperoxide glutathione peroxidase-like [Diorhabda sublineata]|uniref:phospholipid hydroperoxide glutathione peroxidase-like n=1 Tax=Diorhabda sublineata TaxID=1163346 RepID=UPI0024E0B4A3|nr:phospholipid hydroperoxide glutathione peroxidase-like [Diorhabda sublineata]
MPLTRSATSGNKNNNQKEVPAITKKTKGKGPKRGAEKDIEDLPPKKIEKRAENEEQSEGNNVKKVTKQSKMQKKVQQAEGTPDIEQCDNESTKNADTIYNFTANDIQGNPISLEKYKGHVCIIVNVASKCGHTKSNYEQFVEIFDKYSKEKGLRILAFPCNQFGKQEPGDNDKICEFAKKKNVNFDMFEKIDVNGKNAHPLWKFLTEKIKGPKGNNIAWNFTKFIINKNGEVVERHQPSKKPLTLVDNLEKYW